MWQNNAVQAPAAVAATRGSNNIHNRSKNIFHIACSFIIILHYVMLTLMLVYEHVVYECVLYSMHNVFYRYVACECMCECVLVYTAYEDTSV